MSKAKDKPIKKVIRKPNLSKALTGNVNLSNALMNNQNARKHDPEQLAIDLDEWSQREDSQWLMQFAIEFRIPSPSYLGELANQSDSFRESLQIAKYRMALRNTKKLHAGEYNSVQFQREIGMYDAFLKAHDREEKEFEASLKNKDNQAQVNEEAIKSASLVMAAIEAFQKKKSC